MQAVKEGAEGLVAERIAAAERAVDDRRRHEEAAEEAKFMGERVTRDRFAAWRASFRASLQEDEDEDERRRLRDDAGARKSGAGAPPPDKLTGRQLWERGLVGRGEEDLGEDEAAAPAVGNEG